jgi:hypothetical protein
MSQQHRARRVGFRDLGSQRDRRLDFRYPAILDRQGLADPRPTETTSDRPARFRRGGLYGDGCTLAIRARAQGEREGKGWRLPLYVQNIYKRQKKNILETNTQPPQSKPSA